MSINEDRSPIARLRHHVTGAIERGEATPIVEVPAAHVIVNECGEPGCTRPTCLPPDYPPECARHHLRSIDRAQAEADAQFRARMAALAAEKGIVLP